MRDAVIRGVRTFLQAFLGVFIALSTSGAMGIDSVPDLEVLKRATIAAGWAGVVAAVSFVQNALEDASGHRGLK
jgi:hypothetical protein